MHKALDIVRFLLLPAVPAYWAIVKLRNWLFDKDILKSERVNAIVVSVGNLTVGGSGKTPLTIFLAGFLKEMNRKVGVLSRGYGRSTKGYLTVSYGKELEVSVSEAGDEIYQTVLECNIPAAVCEKRVYGAEKMIDATGVDTIILDDGFQHRWIERDLNILIYEQRFLVTPGLRRMVLPTGNLREPFRQTKRADVIVLNRKFSEQKLLSEYLLKVFGNKPVFEAYYKAVGFVDVKSGAFYPSEEFYGQKSLVVCGIANPVSVMNAMLKTGIDTTNKLIFKDHKSYSETNVQKIRKQFYATNASSVITTQKDSVKLIQFARELDDIDIYYLKIEMCFDREEAFKEFIKEAINKKDKPNNNH